MASIEYRPYASKEVDAGGFVVLVVVTTLLFAFFTTRKPI